MDAAGLGGADGNLLGLKFLLMDLLAFAGAILDIERGGLVGRKEESLGLLGFRSTEVVLVLNDTAKSEAFEVGDPTGFVNQSVYYVGLLVVLL